MSVQASLDLDCDMLYSVDALEYRKVLVLAVDLNLVVAVETCRKGGSETLSTDVKHAEKVVKPIPPRDLQGTLCARHLKELLGTKLAESQS
jgi:hypothetical protein